MFYCFLATGFEEIEAITTVDILRRAGIDVKTVAVGGGTDNCIKGAHNIPVIADLSDAEVTTDNLQGVILPGGMPGTVNLEDSSVVIDAIRYCADNDLYIFAICAAPRILGHMGLLKGKQATCYPGYESELEGAVYSQLPAVKDGNVITGKGPGCTVDFAMLITETLCGAQKAAELKSAMQCHE